jgi:anti-sigma factor RsiW
VSRAVVTKACLRFTPMIGSRPDELAPDEARAFAEHLAACEPCAARAADFAALDGMLPEALLRAANGRDFGAFSDEVMARIPAYERSDRAELPPQAASRSAPVRFWSWVRHHRAVAAVSALAPTLAALALVVYLGRGNGPELAVEVVAEGRAAMVLETSDGPVVLLGDDEPAGT